MENFKCTILEDKSRLQEIYDLRTTVFEHSVNSIYVNKKIFPEGWKDHLDERSVHWIVEDNNNIIAAVRMSILYDLEDMHVNVSAFELPAERPFGYYARMVARPDFQGRGICKLFDEATLKYAREQNLSFVLGISASPRRLQTLLRLGFEDLGVVKYHYAGLSSPEVLRNFSMLRIVKK
jgi:GNAT superfamily N-acetyltransferase